MRREIINKIVKRVHISLVPHNIVCGHSRLHVIEPEHGVVEQGGVSSKGLAPVKVKLHVALSGGKPYLADSHIGKESVDEPSETVIVRPTASDIGGS